MSRVVIVGASVGGLKTAQALRGEGFEGEIVLIDQEHHPTYDKPPLSKKYLMGAAARHEIELLSERETQGIGALSIFGSPAASLDADRKVVTLEDGAAVPYDTLVIATGSRARRSPWGEGEHIHLLRTSGDAERLRDELATTRHLVVIGAGFIGGEAAATAIMAGVRVSMVDPFPAPMSRVLNAEVGQIFSRKYAQEGVEEYFGRTVEGVEQTTDGVRVVLDGGEIIEADAALVGIGAVVNTEWLESSGIELDNGVVCDSTLRAIGHPEIFAVGDIARWASASRNVSLRLEHWTNAVDQARVAAHNIAHPDDCEDYETTEYVWSDQYDWKIQVVGRTGTDDIVVIGSEENQRFAVLYSEDGEALTGALVVNWPRALVDARRAVAARTDRAEIAARLTGDAARPVTPAL
ncbi:MAG TPA: FAD-dependent oxidoreductase [Rhodoglobus sp.]|nr:FAD-dependent oxidoreductase [Rhodoglobus sp.]